MRFTLLGFDQIHISIITDSISCFVYCDKIKKLFHMKHEITLDFKTLRI